MLKVTCFLLMFHVSCLESAGFTHHKLSQIRCLFGKSCSFNPFDLPAWFVLILGSIQEMEGPKAPQSWHIFTLQINWHSKPTGEMMDLSLNECEKVYHSYSRFVDAYLPKVSKGYLNLWQTEPPCSRHICPSKMGKQIAWFWFLGCFL